MKRYVPSESTISSAMQQLIDNVAAEWRNDMKEQDCETFKEFVQLNDYDASDIRNEIRYMVDRMFGGYMYDDGTVVGASDDTEMSYGKFKKAVIDKIRGVE